ncbi:helix-turn-helix transcriptional regulator [Streptomyces sp. NPDC048595]|uniref:helix-turn-helix transcriptional regulator n=1 Tax=Streptomyces sp. NPDC048595 TaxID=3365576 RepID=UPI00371A1ADF
MSAITTRSAAAAASRRGELAAFLRLRRERLTPEEVGLPGGPRRRTPGLRREEVAQRAGVGVAWYTWLEQGRAINPSVQVLDAIARALVLGPEERAHLHRLAGVPGAVGCPPARHHPLPPEAHTMQTILDSLSPLPASMVSAGYDVLAFNDAYAALDPRMELLAPSDRNVLWRIFTADEESQPLVDWEREVSFMVGQLRAEFGRRLTDPRWRGYIRKLSEASPLFVELWSRHEVSAPVTHRKQFRTADGRTVAITATGFTTTAVPDAKMWVYTPADQDAVRVIGELLDRYREIGAAGLVAAGAGREAEG